MSGSAPHFYILLWFCVCISAVHILVHCGCETLPETKIMFLQAPLLFLPFNVGLLSNENSSPGTGWPFIMMTMLCRQHSCGTNVTVCRPSQRSASSIRGLVTSPRTSTVIRPRPAIVMSTSPHIINTHTHTHCNIYYHYTTITIRLFDSVV